MKATMAALALALSLGAARAEPTVEQISLVNSQDRTQVWTTEPVTTEWILGVSDQPAGPLLNAADSSVSGLPPGTYWLFADPGTLGEYPALLVRFSNGRRLAAVFRVKGVNGTDQAWQRVAGSAELSVGWAPGVIDLVGTTNGVAPDGINDLYMVVTVGRAPGSR